MMSNLENNCENPEKKKWREVENLFWRETSSQNNSSTTPTMNPSQSLEQNSISLGSDKKKKEILIAVDCDETLVPFVKNLANYYNRTHNPVKPLEESDFWSYTFCNVWGGTNDAATEIVETFFTEPEFDDERPLPKSFEILKKLQQDYGFKFVIITARFFSFIFDKKTQKIQKYFSKKRKIHSKNQKFIKKSKYSLKKSKIHSKKSKIH